jgi:hypothetical protein
VSRRLKRLIKTFSLEEKNRSRIELGAGVRLNPATHKVQLAEDDSDEYPTDPDLYVKTWVTHPTTVKQWLSFEAVIQHGYDGGTKKTADAIQYRGRGLGL